jgi:hypothetical protein
MHHLRRDVVAAMAVLVLNAGLMLTIDPNVATALGIHLMTLLVLTFGLSAFVVAAFADPPRGRMLVMVFAATILGPVVVVADDPGGLLGGLLVGTIAGSIPATSGMLAGFVISRWRNDAPVHIVQDVAMLAPALVLLVAAIAFPEMLTPTLDF